MSTIKFFVLVAVCIVLMAFDVAVCYSADDAEEIVVYESKYSADVLKKYRIIESEHVLPEDESFEQHVENYRKLDFDSGRVNVEVVLFRRCDQTIAKITKAYGVIAVEDAREQWLPFIKEKLTVDGTSAGFSTTSVTAWMHHPEARFLADVRYVAEVETRLRHEDGAKMEFSILEIPKGELSLHDFLSNVIGRDFEIRETKHGQVLAGVGRQSCWVGWKSGDRRMVFGYAESDNPDVLVNLIGAKFPSSLPKGLVVDRTKWAREEARLGIALLEKILNSPPEPFGHFNLFLGRLSRYVYFPDMQNWRTLALESKHHPQILEELNDWWKKHGESTYWDEELNRLVATGQTPRELAARAAELAARKEEMRLATPMTNDEKEAAEIALYQFADDHWNDRYEQYRTRRRDMSDVSLDRPMENTLVIAYKLNGVKTVITVYDPEMKGSGTSLEPLIAESKVRMSEPKRDQDFLFRYQFDRDKYAWALAEVEEQ